MSFGSLMFLEKSPERLTRRTRIERWLLLALRCLALLAFAFLFGRPYLPALSLPSEAETNLRALVIVDSSASMRREDLWGQAVKLAEETIRSYDAGASVGVGFFDESLEIVGDDPAWKGLSPAARVGELQKAMAARGEDLLPGWKRTDLGRSLVQSMDWLSDDGEDDGSGRRELVVISDFQEGSDRTELNQIAWPENVAVRCLGVEPGDEANLSLSLAAQKTENSLEAQNSWRVRVSSSGLSAPDRFRLEWENHPETATEAYLAPGSSRVVSSPSLPAGERKGVLLLSGDAHDFDNRIYVAVEDPRRLPILFLSAKPEREKAGSALFYLDRALQDTPALAPVLEVGTLPASTVDLTSHEVVVLEGVWGDEIAGRLHEFSTKGGLVVALPSADTRGESLGALVGEPENWKLKESEKGDYAMLASLDFEHPVLAPFARANVRDFTKIRFWKHRSLDLGDQADSSLSIIARFDGGDPAIVEKKVGEGSVMVFLSGWEPSESQLALSSKFVPILYSILENAGYTTRTAPTAYVGEKISESSSPGESLPAKPGFYESVRADATSSTRSVNLHPSEGRTEAFDPDSVLSEFGVSLLNPRESGAANVEGDQDSRKKFESAEKERRQKLWKWLVICVLVILIAETWLAGRGRTPRVEMVR